MRKDFGRMKVSHFNSVHRGRTSAAIRVSHISLSDYADLRQRDISLPLFERVSEIDLHARQRHALRLVNTDRPRVDEWNLDSSR